MAAEIRVRKRMKVVFPWLLMKLLALKLPNAGKKYMSASNAKNSGAEAYVCPKRDETAGSARHTTKAAIGTTRKAAYLTEYWKTFCRVPLSFCASSLLNAGKSIVVIGVAKNPIKTTKVDAIPKLPMAMLSVT